MSLLPRATAVVFVCLCLSVTAFALPPITAAASGNSVRFSAPGAVCQIRVQVAAADGTPLFDSSWKDGDVFDWQAGELTGGSYRCVISVKDLEGQTTQREATLVSRDGQISIEPRSGDEGSPKVTLLAHDGANGAIVSTAGDLGFRFGNFLAGKDVEAMRLTPDGKLSVKSILFSDGTILTTERGQLITRQGSSPAALSYQTTGLNAGANAPAARKLIPKTDFTPAYQFTVDASGVTVGTTNPAYNLNVSGYVNSNTQFDIGNSRFVATNAAGNDAYLGFAAGAAAPSGGANTFLGVSSGTADTTGGANTFVGHAAGNGNVAGSFNTFVGDTAGGTHDHACCNIAIGTSADVPAGVSGAVAIGFHAAASQNNTVILGSITGVNGAGVTASTGIGTQTPNQYLGVGGGITVDGNNTNNGSVLTNSVIAFGSGASNAVSGEAIASQRTATGGNQFGLDFYTLYTKRMSIANDGTVTVFGSLVKPAGSFKIDHPRDPKEKYLSHSFVESPDMMNIYNGNVVLDENGEAVVQLPDWFEALNQDFRYQLTCLHGWAPVYVDEEIANNQFKIAGGKPGMKVSWQVTGIRHDPYANAHRIVVEEDKPAAERGTYLYPDVYAPDRD